MMRSKHSNTDRPEFWNHATILADAKIGLRAGFNGRRWAVFGEMRNLFDTDYIATLSVLNVASADVRALYPGAPLSAYTGLRFSF